MLVMSKDMNAYLKDDDAEKLQRMAGVSTDVVMNIERTIARLELCLFQPGKMWMGQHVRPKIQGYEPQGSEPYMWAVTANRTLPS